MSGVNFADWTSDNFVNNQKAYETILEDGNLVKEIPSLNASALHDLRDGQLVRFQGMIQDMYNPELYFQSYEVKNTITGDSYMKCGMFKDSATCQKDEDISIDSDKNKSADRQTLVIISVPGLNNWAKEKSTSFKCPQASLISTKRSLEENEDEPMDTTPQVTKKEKKENISDKIENKTVFSREHLLNLPIPTSDGKACIVKIYDDSAQYKLNQVLDVIGFISLDPMLSTMCNSEDMIDDAEIQTHNPPASIVPRLHAIKVTEKKTNHDNTSNIMSQAQSIRGDIHMVLSQLLFGDSLVADYVICHLISRIYIRKDFHALGSFPLNITNFPIQKYKTFPKDFYDLLSQLVPKSHSFECTLENLNDLSLLPKKDYESNRLTSGILQLSNNTHLVIDETKLTIGHLSPAGRQNYQAISDLIATQKITYDFQYYKVDYDTDIPVLILSETKSFIPCATQVPLKVDPETENLYPQVVEATKQYLKDEERLLRIRQYLEVLRNSDFIIEEELLNVIQEDFVELRKSDKSISADNLHTLMVLARYMSLSYGRTSLEFDCWKRTLEMETQRLARLPPRKK